jgi:S-adenosylmethionine:tRNA ribosyltransferase-isomerase
VSSSTAVHDTPAGTPMAAYDYGLPDSAVAQEPVEPRSAARLLVGPGAGDDRGVMPAHATVADLPVLLGPGDVLVVNDTRVLAARLRLAKRSGGRAEVLLVEPLGPPGPDGVTEWVALVRPGRRLPPGTLLVEDGAGVGTASAPAAPVVEVGEPIDADPEGPGTRRVRLLDPTVVVRAGTMPLPPYIHRALGDPDRYQTVYSAPRDLVDRSTAAPTAGLHFTPDLLAACEAAGARIARVDLAIGLDTFRSVTAATAEAHVIHTERYRVPPETVAACVSARRVVAVGTTAVRALESAAATGQLAGRTDLYIYGAYEFRVVDLLVTNFHLPRSSLLLLVEAFCGPVWRDLYDRALSDDYRFLSFGDAMVVGRAGPKGVPAWTVPGEAVPTEAVRTEAVPTETVPTATPSTARAAGR